jgi:hypothetical protein
MLIAYFAKFSGVCEGKGERMKSTKCVFLLTVIILCSQLYSVTTTEYDKAYHYLNARNEVYFAIYPNSPEELKPLIDDITIDRIDEGNNKVIAYANKKAFKKFLQYNLRYEVLLPPCFENVAPMSDYKDYLLSKRSGLKKTVTHGNWLAYPTYDAYVQMMAQFQTSFPNLAKEVVLGTTVQGRQVLALKVTKNVSASNGKPRFLQTATVHGDEVLNYINTLHMIDTLLDRYGLDTRLTRLLDNIEFWFVPLYNPDGTYRGGNATVQSAQRYNQNGVDLNRNYPCPCGQTGSHALYGLYTSREPENLAVFNLWQKYVFHLSTDQHGGTETVLWPYGAISRRPCDEAWYIWAATRFVDTVHKACNNNGYFTSCGGDGKGNIYSELYVCHGTSIDYSLFYNRGRPLPMETSLTKLVPASSIATYWDYQKEALIQFYELLLTGIQGTVKNSVTKAPILHAKSSEATHDFDSAWSYTDTAGFYLRFILQGTWNLTFSAPGYVSKTVTITVNNYGIKYPLDVELDPLTAVRNNGFSPIRISTIVPHGRGIKVNFGTAQTETVVGIYTMSGSVVRQLEDFSASSLLWDGTDGSGRVVRNGSYIIKVSTPAGMVSKNFVINR